MQVKKINKSIKYRQQSLLGSYYKNAPTISNHNPYKSPRTAPKTYKNKKQFNNSRNISNTYKASNRNPKQSNSVEIQKRKTLENSKLSKLSQKKCGQKMTMTQPDDHQLRYKYDEAINQVFSILDIFNRGQISQANITAQIPVKVLYFLGQSFQKIRMYRKPVNKQFFKNQCVKIFRKSAKQDIEEFISEIKCKTGDNYQKQSVEQDPKLTIQSHVQHRMVFQPSNREITKKQNAQKIYNQNIIIDRKIRNKKNYHQDDFRQSLKGIRYKNQRNAPTPLVQINNFQNVAKTAFEHSFIKATQKINGFINTSINQSKTNINEKQKLNKDNGSPCFRMSRLNVFEEGDTLKCQEICAKYRPKAENYQNPLHQKTNKPKNAENRNMISFNNQDRCLQREKEQSKIQHKNDEIKYGSNDKLDKLSNRLEDYIKQNALRLERSKNARIGLQ